MVPVPLPEGFSIGSVQINGKTLFELFQLDLSGVFQLKAFKEPEDQRQLRTASENRTGTQVQTASLLKSNMY